MIAEPPAAALVDAVQVPSAPTPSLHLCILGDAIQYHLRRWSQYFSHHGHKVDVVTFNPDQLPNFGEVHVHVVRKRWSGSSLIARALSAVSIAVGLRRYFREARPDIVHVFSATWYAILAMVLWRGPFLVTPLGSDVLIELDESRIKKMLVGYTLRRASRVHSDGHNVREVLLALGVAPERIIMATYGVDVTRFCPDPATRRSDTVTVISTRRLDPVHDVDTFIRAIPLILERCPETEFRIAGPGSELDRLRALARALGLANRVTFLGRIEESEMVRALQSADIYVATSLSESGLAASTAEAMACEIAVINTDTGDIRSWITDGESGVIVPSGRPDVIAARIIQLVENPALRHEFAAKTRQEIVERNNYHTQMRFMEQVYGSLVGSR